MNQNLESLKERVSRLSVMIFDIDGTLTDGRIFWVPNSGWTQMYSVRDGMGIKRLQEAGLEVAAISGGDSLSAQMRMQSLGLKHVHFGSQDKVAHFEKLLEALEGDGGPVWVHGRRDGGSAAAQGGGFLGGAARGPGRGAFASALCGAAPGGFRRGARGV
ncbi:hypothetical protein ACN28I_26815 [Archangium gephyra]|uniref:hypothetical protein n=1 Tax=Archangium gephyra TaxID=48 RepID=UPI003B786627